jgi:hypothetical protein
MGKGGLKGPGSQWRAKQSAERRESRLITGVKSPWSTAALREISARNALLRAQQTVAVLKTWSEKNDEEEELETIRIQQRIIKELEDRRWQEWNKSLASLIEAHSRLYL